MNTKILIVKKVKDQLIFANGIAIVMNFETELQHNMGNDSKHILH